MADNVERVLADIDADHGDRGVELLRHGVLLVFGAPCQLLSLAGRKHGRTIPLADVTTATYRGISLTFSCEYAPLAGDTLERLGAAVVEA
jgi:hypothetical protein